MSKFLFLSTLSLRRATSAPRFTPAASRNFYPRSPCGERRASNHRERQVQHISIHALLAESDIEPLIFSVQPRNFYPRSPCGERRAPRFTPAASRNFYPRSPCGERPYIMTTTICTALFLSTLSLRRATACTMTTTICIALFLSTLSLRRATGLGWEV